MLFIGNLLAYAAMAEGHKVTYMPVYGVEMRGGTANCTVVVSDDEIGSPVVQHPACSVVMNKPSLDKFGPRTRNDGLVIVNASLIKPQEVKLKGPEILMVPCIELAKEATGNDRLFNMVILGAIAEKTGATSLESLKQAMVGFLPESAQKMIPANETALERGVAFARNGN